MEKSSINKWVNLTKEVGDNLNSEETKSIFEAIKTEIGEIKLDAQAKEEFRLQTNADQSASDKWKTVSDVLNHVDLHTLSQKYPGAAKSALSTVIFIIGLYFPAIHIADGFIAKLPDSVAAKFVQFGASLTPTHLVNKTIKTIADKKSVTDAKELSAADTSEDSSDKTILFIVCKDDILSKFILRLVNSNDDIDENNVVGTKDGSIQPIVMNEKAWLAQRSEEVIEDKVMFIGDIKDTEAFINATEPTFNELGVKYGWSGNRAYIISNVKGVLSKSDYSSLLAKLQNLQIPDKYKSDLKIKMNALTVGKILLATPILLKDGYDEISSKKRQQLLYGISEFYKNGLSEFLSND